LQNELQKLAANNPKIVRETIDTLVVPSTEYSSFTLVDALVKKDLSRTLKLYDQLTTQGEADQMILGAIMYQYRVFLAIIAGGDATKTMGIAPYALQKSHRVMRNMDLADLKTAYNCLAEADLAIKSGRLSSQEALKRLFRKLCS
jgi:DNA polymerase III delta subunit